MWREKSTTKNSLTLCLRILVWTMQVFIFSSLLFKILLIAFKVVNNLAAFNGLDLLHYHTLVWSLKTIQPYSCSMKTKTIERSGLSSGIHTRSAQSHDIFKSRLKSYLISITPIQTDLDSFYLFDLFYNLYCPANLIVMLFMVFVSALCVCVSLCLWVLLAFIWILFGLYLNFCVSLGRRVLQSLWAVLNVLYEYIWPEVTL